MAGILLVLLQCLLGYCILVAVRPTIQSLLQAILLSCIIGMGSSTMLFFFLELLTISLTTISLFILHGIVIIAFGVYFYVRRVRIRDLTFPLGKFPRIYEFVWIIPILILLFISAWRTYYYPPYSFDTTLGPDLVATYTVLEGHINNSVYSELNPHSNYHSTQTYYAPFVMLMQSMFRIAGWEFGQTWLAILTVAFFLYLYTYFRSQIHPILAGLMVLTVLITPELFAYTFILQTDFSNAVFFCIGAIFFSRFLSQERGADLIFAILAMSLACWTRTETIFFIPAGALLLFLRYYRMSMRKALSTSVAFLVVPALAVILWNVVFVGFYLPETSSVIKNFLFDFNNLWSRATVYLKDMIDKVYGQDEYWSYTTHFFIAVSLPCVIYSIYKKDFKGFSFIYWAVFMWMMFILLLLFIPAVNVDNTFRRGYFKIIFLMYCFLATCGLMKYLSQRLHYWETGLVLSPDEKT